MRLTEYGQRFLLKAWLIVVISLLAICIIASALLGVARLLQGEESPSASFDEPDSPSIPSIQDEPTVPAESLPAHARVLSETEQAEQSYIDQMIFVGESTTAHLRSRGVLSEGTKTKQVWSNASNTMTLDLNILQKTIQYPKTGQSMTISQAVALEKPALMVLSFGTNGIVGFERNLDLYGTAYGRLIDAIHDASPDTVVLLQTVYPLAINQKSFSENASTINGYIAKLNEKLVDVAEQHDAYVVDTASCLTDDMGFLRQDYQNGDGVHLTAQAYHAILAYLRTHAYPLP